MFKYHTFLSIIYTYKIFKYTFQLNYISFNTAPGVTDFCLKYKTKQPLLHILPTAWKDFRAKTFLNKKVVD